MFPRRLLCLTFGLVGAHFIRTVNFNRHRYRRQIANRLRGHRVLANLYRRTIVTHRRRRHIVSAAGTHRRIKGGLFVAKCISGAERTAVQLQPMNVTRVSNRTTLFFFQRAIDVCTDGHLRWNYFTIIGISNDHGGRFGGVSGGHYSSSERHGSDRGHPSWVQPVANANGSHRQTTGSSE